MPVPKRRRSKSKKRIKRAGFKVTAPNLVACTTCGAKILSHFVCPECGSYDKKQVLTIKEKTPKKDA